MKQTVNESTFRDAFRAMGREAQFSHQALGALFDYLEELEQDAGTEWELDVIALCCEWSEYASALEAVEQYDYEPEGDDEEEREANALDWLHANTIVIEFDGGLLVQEF